MLPYDIQRRCASYVQSTDLEPTIRQCIYESVVSICGANEPGKDWSFLKASFELTREEGYANNYAVFSFPSNMRSCIEIVGILNQGTLTTLDELLDDGYDVSLIGREITITGETAIPAGVLVVNGYQCHPEILVADATHTSPTWDTPWTTSWPAENVFLLPDEAYTLLVDYTLLRLKQYEIEVAFSVQELTQRIELGLAQLRANYALQVYPLNAPETPDVKWLIAVGQNIVGSERHNNQLLAIVNELVADFADAIKLRIDQRPSHIVSVTESLPELDGVAVPTTYWQCGMAFKVAAQFGGLTEAMTASWERAKQDWVSSFYAKNVTPTNMTLSTFGELVDYIKRTWKSNRSDMQAWDIANEMVAKVMDRVNTDKLLTSKTVASADGEDTYSFDAFTPKVKCIVQIELDGNVVAGRSFAARGPVTPDMNAYQGIKPSCQAFRIVGNNIRFDKPLTGGRTIRIWYCPQHTWTTNPNSTVPVEPMLVMKAIKAEAAVEDGDMAKASFYQQEFEQAIGQYNANQARNYAADDKVINATPRINKHILRNFRY